MVFSCFKEAGFLFWFFIKVQKNKKMLNNVLWTLIRETRTQNFNYSYCDLPELGFQIIFTLSTKTSSAKSDKIVV